jgi:hypothetical protein
MAFKTRFRLVFAFLAMAQAAARRTRGGVGYVESPGAYGLLTGPDRR